MNISGDKVETTVQDALLYEIPANSYVEILDSGYRIGFTYVDREDLFLRSLNPKMLQREVDKISIKNHPSFNVAIYSVEIK